MPILFAKRFRLRYVLPVAMLMLAFIIIGIFLAGYTANIGANLTANAAIPTSYSNLTTGRGLNIYNTESLRGTHTYDVLLTSRTHDNYANTTHGDYIFDNMGDTTISTSVMYQGLEVWKYSDVPKGQNRTYNASNPATFDHYQHMGFTYTSTDAPTGTITVNVPIVANSNLYKAINDPMLDVRIHSYANMIDTGLTNGTDTAKSTIRYYDGTPSAPVVGVKNDVRFPETYQLDKDYMYPMSQQIKMSGCETGAYVQLVFSDFVKGGNNYKISISKLAFRITITPTDFRFKDPESSDIQIIDADGTRNEDAANNMVKKGDVIVIDTKLQINENFLNVNTGIAGDSNPTGKFYRNLMLNSETGTSRTSTKYLVGTNYKIEGVSTYNKNDMVTWSFDKTAVTRIYNYTDANGVYHDLTTGYDALTAAFYVNDSTRDTVHIKCSMLDASGLVILGDNGLGGSTSGRLFSYMIDSQLPNAPYLNASTTFYQKYISNKEYYTKIAGYNNELDRFGNSQVKSVTIGSQQEGSTATVSSQTTSLQGLSAEIVYYRVTRLERDPNNYTAELFTREQATGIYCITTPTYSLVNDKYVITGQNTIYQGMELMLRQGDSVENHTYPKQGIYKVEFISYDQVGNISAASSAVIIRVDVADYQFEVVTQIGLTQVQLGTETFNMLYYALDDNNKLQPRNNATFKRGDRIVLKLDFTTTGYSNYILTLFRTPAGFELNTAEFPYDNELAIFITNSQQSSAIPTFVLSTNYSGDDKAHNRKLILTFKRRAQIAVSNTTPIYEPGLPRTVNAIATIGGKKVTNVSIETTYSETKDGVYRGVSENFPVNAGEYYYRCVLNSTDYYGFVTNKMTIVKATPVISEVRVSSIDYGESLATRDTVYNSALKRFVMSDTIFCSYTYFDDTTNTTKKISVSNRSSNGVYGYFSIVDPSSSSADYSKPSAGTIRVRILFTPIVMQDQYTPKYDANGNFIVNSNYFTVTVSDVQLVINHSTNVTKTVANLDSFGKVINQYTGKAQNISVDIRANDDGRTIILNDYINYTFTNVATGITNAVVPISAGNYVVNYSLNKNLCNYTGSWSQPYVIEKRKLLVICDDMASDFQRELKPAPTAKYFSAGETLDYIGLKYNFTYYYYNDITKTKAENAIEDNLVPNTPESMFNNMPWVAGRYVVKVTINDTNLENESDCLIVYTIKKVTALDNAYMTAQFPNLNWTTSTSGYHIDYLQPLKAISIATNQNTNIQYSYHYMDLGKVKYRWEIVQGKFVVAKERYTGDYSTQSVAEFVAIQREYSSLVVGQHSLYLYFVPNDSNLANFNLLDIPCQVNVGKAQPIFYDIETTPITYGKAIQKIDDITLSKDVENKKAVKFKLYNDPVLGMQYYYLPENQYTFSLFTTSTPILPAGNNNVIITFNPNDTANFMKDNGTVVLTVNKRTVDISFAKNENYDQETDTYIYPYRAYSNSEKIYNTAQLVKPTDNPLGGYAVYNYDENNPNNRYKGTRYTNPILVANNKYVVEYTISDANYTGSNYYVVKIIKDTLRRTADPVISLAQTAVSYNKLMSGVSFSGGSMLANATNQRVEGVYSFNYESGTRFTTMGFQTLKLKFVPTDTANYNVYEGTEAGDYRISVNVVRADISSGLTLHVEDYIYGDLNYNWDFAGTTYTSTIYTNGTNFAESKLDETYRYIDGTLSINNRPMTGYFNAGTYNVTFKVNEDSIQKYYTGSITVPMKIAKKKALLEVEVSQRAFNNKMQSAGVGVFLAVIDGENVTKGERLNETVVQTFYKNGAKMANRPSQIGTYTVEFALQSVNYEYYYGENLRSDFTIAVDETQIIINNLNQVYSVQRPLGVSLGINSAVYTLKYYDEITSQEYLALPINAGSYYVHLEFDSPSNNGYQATVVYKDRLIIDKYTANILTSEIISADYTGKKNPISVRTEPYNLPFTTTYLKQGELEFTANEVFEANTNGGYHEIKFVINSSNYKGEKTIRYYILPANLTIGSHPTFGTYAYNTDIQPTVLTRGEVRFGYDKIIEQGLYEIPIESIKYLDTGSYSVNYRFTAYTNEGEIDTNYKVAIASANLTIVKQNIDASKIVIPDNIPMSVRFNNGYHYVYALLCSGDELCQCHKVYTPENIDKDGLIYNINSNNKDFSIRIRYNGTSDPALGRGEYTISAFIESKNYSGSTTFAKKLIVEKGVPDIRVKPSVATSVDLGIKKVGDSYVYPNLNNDDIVGGQAFILDTNTRIGGTFTLVSGEKLTKANINLIKILFTPDDIQNFNLIEVTIQVNVIGINPLKLSTGDEIVKNADWTSLELVSNVDGQSFANVKIAPKAGNIVYYGQRLDAFELVFENLDGSQNNDYFNLGHLSFVNSSYIPDVGELVQVKFTPFEASYGHLYNEMYGTILLPIVKTTRTFSYNLIGFDGKSLNQDMVFDILDSDKKVELKGGSLTIYTDATKSTLFNMDAPIVYEQGKNIEVYVVYSSTNYTDIETAITVSIYNRIEELDINVEFLQKEYTEDNGIIISDLKPTTNVVGIDAKFISLAIFDSNGNVSDGKKIGEYTVIITIDNGEYYGQKEISNFTVVRKDISSQITLNEFASTYNNVNVPLVLYKGETLSSSYYSLAYKKATNPDANYSQSIGEDADTYNVRVVINSENYFGTRVFTYVVEPIKVRILSWNKEVVFGSIEAIAAPEVEFRMATSEDSLSLDYTLYYYNNNYTITTKKPSDVGIYTVRCVINDTNYASNGQYTYQEFSYTITKAEVMIFQVPTILSELGQGNVTYNIKYGQALSDVKIQGGQARRNNVPVDGTFSIENQSLRPNAGTFTITIVFTPNNSNLATAKVNEQITVARGEAQVIVDNLYAKYDNISKKDFIKVTVQPAGVQVRITFTNSRGEDVKEPTNAGTYYINAVSLNDNYNVTISKSSDGSMTPRLVIAKAKVQMINGAYNVKDPEALGISAGDSLAKSSLTQKSGYGEVYFEGFSKPIAGSFSYIQSALIFNNAGVYQTGYLFTPSDINNFDTYQGTVFITVNKAFATISVSNTRFVYGEGFSFPTFTTSPSGLTYDWGLQEGQPNVRFIEYDPNQNYNQNDVIKAGTYQCRVWITSENYSRNENFLDFTIYVAKKDIDLSFVDSEGKVVTQYITTYGVPLEADIKLYSENNSEGKRGYLIKDEIVNNVKIGETRYTRYVSTDLGRYYDNRIAPKDKGSYEVSVSIISENYTASGNIMYVINRGIIEEVIFDTDSLENQIYGLGVSAPKIYTRPSNISYYIVYQGYSQMPKDAGNYNIMVYFDDDNFDKKQVFAMFKINPKKITIDRITVQDKVYDGVSTIKVDGQLKDVEVDDQVTLRMSATTANNAVNVGKHSVVITDYTITGLAATNYIVEKPIVHTQVNILTNVISAPKSKSYVTSATGFSPGTSVAIAELNVKENKTNIFTKAMGVESTIIGFSLKENGKEAIMKDMIKVYIAIPEKYIGTDFEVKLVERTEGQAFIYNREGNYITFMSTNSGSVAFEKKEFQYGFVVIVISIVLIIIGVVVLFILNPVHSRKKTTDTSKQKAVIKRIRRGY